MKARLLPLCLLTVALCAIPAVAQSDAAKTDAPKPDSSGQMAKRRQEMLERFDKNGDGKLDDEEKAEMKATLKKEKEAGPRGSGDISSLGGGDSASPGAAAGGERFVLEMIKRFDKDGDGKLDAAELTEALKARGGFMNGRGPGGAGGPGGPAGQMRAQMIKMFDKNGDGVLDEDERAEAMKFRDEQLKRFDKNGDGKLDDEERAEAMKAFMSDHPEMVPPGQ